MESISSGELAAEVHNWNLSSDSKLLNVLRKFSISLSERANALVKTVDDLSSDVTEADVRLRNTLNEFLMLANTQFIENVRHVLIFFIFPSGRVIVCVVHFTITVRHHSSAKNNMCVCGFLCMQYVVLTSLLFCVNMTSAFMMTTTMMEKAKKSKMTRKRQCSKIQSWL
jgi:hypothetical protein